MHANRAPGARGVGHVTFDSSVPGEPDAATRLQSPVVPPMYVAPTSNPKRHPVVRKIMQQTIGDHMEHSGNLNQLQAFVASVETYCGASDTLASIGKSLYTSPVVVFVVDEMMRVILWNDCAVQLIGFTRDEMAGRHLIQEFPYLVSPQSVAMLNDALARCVHSGQPITGVILEFSKRDHSKVRLMSTCTPLISNPVGKGMLVVAQDVTHLPIFEKKHLAGTPAISDHGMRTSVRLIDGWMVRY